MEIVTKPYAIVLAGGRGSRLPIAGSIPKQFAPKFDDEEHGKVTFVQDVVKMITNDVIKPSRVIVVVTNEEQRDYAIDQLTPYKVPSTNVVMFDPHLGYVAVMAAAADYIRQHEEKAVAFITPSDSHIEGQEELTMAIMKACYEARNGRSVLVGAKVADANIVGGCGNAQYDSSEDGPFYEILDFIEKPAKFGPDRVKQILMDDNTVVNTGLYAIRVDKFCKAYPMEKINALLKKYYDEGSEKTDLGLDPTDMVKRLNMKLLIGGFEWKDCGTLDAYYKIQRVTPNHRNASIGNIIRYECLDGLFVCATKGVRMYASFIKGGIAAIAYMTPAGGVNVAVINMKMSQSVGKITDYLESGDPMPYQLMAANNTVMPSNLSSVTKVAFLGVQNIYVFVNRLENGDINVNISGNGECIYTMAAAA